MEAAEAVGADVVGLEYKRRLFRLFFEPPSCSCIDIHFSSFFPTPDYKTFTMISSFFAALALHATLSNAVPLLTRQSNSTRCKVIPGDEGWPSVQTWAQLNQTVEGRLIATVPLGSVCHGSSFDQSQCSKMQSEWGFASLV